MDIHFFDPDDAPVPPDEVRIREMRARPHPDGRRVRVYLEITPFQRRPNAEINIFNQQDEVVAALSVIETIDPRMEFTMHLREPQPGGDYRLEATVLYSDLDLDDPPAEGEAAPVPTIQIADRVSITFTI